ncbi:mercury methylation corrinoid protein HgcA [Thermodesulfobacteriota bacterium]
MTGCCGTDEGQCGCDGTSDLLPVLPEIRHEDVCCGPPPGPSGNPYERPGYTLCHFVDGFQDTPVGMVPKIKTDLRKKDVLGTIRTRLGIGRYSYLVAPGLYCVGRPGPESPVLVTANYKLSFDALRKELDAVDAWVLVIDTRGINVWCAAGKALFSTQEVVRRVLRVGLSKVVRHRELILPQLSATGVSAVQVHKESGFKVVWGPIRARDVKKFLESGMKADKAMRRVSFTLKERVILIPVEISMIIKPSLWILLAIFMISGIGYEIFSFNAALIRGLKVTAAYAGGIFAGAVVTPLFLPWIPGRSFSLKGMMTGVLLGIAFIFPAGEALGGWESFSALFCIIAVSSYLAMNFTGSTPFTSPSGVEKEMRKALPIQALAIFIAAITWVGSAFTG